MGTRTKSAKKADSSSMQAEKQRDEAPQDARSRLFWGAYSEVMPHQLRYPPHFSTALYTKGQLRHAGQREVLIIVIVKKNILFEFAGVSRGRSSVPGWGLSGEQCREDGKEGTGAAASD